MSRFGIVLALGAASGFAQSSNTPQPPTNQPAPPTAAPTAALTSSSSRISHVVAGPDGRVQGLLLHNGTFVTLSPALAQQVPVNLRHNASVSVSGPAYSIGSDRTIRAQQLTIAGASYNDLGGVAGAAATPPQAIAGAPLPPPPVGPAGVAPPPPPPGPGAPPPPPPPPCTGAPVPPPPPAANPAPPPSGTAPAPPTNGTAPPPPSPTGVNPAVKPAPGVSQPTPAELTPSSTTSLNEPERYNYVRTKEGPSKVRTEAR